MTKVVLAILFLSAVLLVGACASASDRPEELACDYLMLKYNRNFEVTEVKVTGNSSYVCTARDNNLVECKVYINEDGTITDTYNIKEEEDLRDESVGNG